MNNDECKMLNVECRRSHRRNSLPGIHHSSFIIHHLSSPPRGISLLEVLISVFILSVGLLGVASLIPIGKLAMIETNKSDRTGACGRAAIHDVRVRGLLNYRNWLTQAGAAVPTVGTPPRFLIIDPLGHASGLLELGGTGSCVQRYTFKDGGAVMDLPAANRLFRWGDELTFDVPQDATKRPRVLARDHNGNVAPYPRLTTDPASTPVLDDSQPLEFANDGNFTWFLAIGPSPAEINLQVDQRTVYNVAVVVCYKRAFSDEQLCSAKDTAGTANPTIANGGGGVTLTWSVGTPETLNVKPNEWIMLSKDDASAANWYRVVHAGPSTVVAGKSTQVVSLVGPDWPLDATINTSAIIIPGVTGVYTTTVQLD